MDIKVCYPGRISEAEVQATLWQSLKEAGILSRLQVTAYNPKTCKRSCTLDVVVYNSQHEAVCIVECKTWRDQYAAVRKYRSNNTKQVTKYRDYYGLPVLIFGQMGKVNETVKEIKEILATFG